MNLVVPRTELTGLIQPFGPASKTGSPAFPIATMLSIHLRQQWFSLSDPAMGDALHDMAPKWPTTKSKASEMGELEEHNFI